MSTETPGPGVVPDLNPELYNLDAEESAFFKQQTGISDEAALKEHIISVQKEAYAIHPYPCIHRFAFTQLKISRLPAYKHVLSLGQSRSTPNSTTILLDIGCCFGNDLRKAIADGFPAAGCIGSDLRPEFWELGHKLFKDDSKFSVPFVAGDAFDKAMLTPRAPLHLGDQDKLEASGPAPILSTLPAQGSLNPLHGRVSIIHASSFFHLFNEDQQSYLAHALGPLLSPEPGSILLGSHGGMAVKGLRPASRGRQMFCHSPESWRELWEGVFGKDQVKVEAELVSRDASYVPGVSGQWSLLTWSVTRI